MTIYQQQMCRIHSIPKILVKKVSKSLKRAAITMSFVGVVVESAVEVAVAFELLGYAVRAIGAAEVKRFVAFARCLHFGPNCPETAPASQFVGSNKPNNKK